MSLLSVKQEIRPTIDNAIAIIHIAFPSEYFLKAIIPRTIPSIDKIILKSVKNENDIRNPKIPKIKDAICI